MIGWDDKTRLVSPPGIEDSLKVERLQHIVNAYCETAGRPQYHAAGNVPPNPG